MEKQITLVRFTYEPTAFTGWKLTITTRDNKQQMVQYFSDKYHGSEQAALAAAQQAQKQLS